MTDFRLCSPRQIEGALARLFLEDRIAKVSVCEDKAFKDAASLDLGSISLACANASQAELRASVRQGSFEWQIPAKAETETALRQLLNFGAKSTSTQESKLSASLNAIAAIGVRTGMTRPCFDAQTLTELPFRRPATVVADTSGVLQGAMDFVANYLHPMARLKIPAVLHMEVINQADRFLKTRRASNVRSEAILQEHLISQTGQRALLRLELRDDAEVERNLLVGDPLRSAFKEDKDPDLRELNLSVPLRGYVDRLILESARQHQSYASPGHPVYLLTSDQGLARMALAEGIPPLFFKAVTAQQFFDRKLTGAMFHPFTGQAVGTPLATVLWELATAFGRVKLSQQDGTVGIEVVAIDNKLGWSSFHSKDDLLWFRSFGVREWPVDGASVAGGNVAKGAAETAEFPASQPAPSPGSDHIRRGVIASGTQARSRSRPIGSGRQPRLSEDNGAGVPFYRLASGGLVALIDRLGESASLTEAEVSDLVGSQHPTGIAAYRRFLASGELITTDGTSWSATEKLIPMRDALMEPDPLRLAGSLLGVPSFSAFYSMLEASSGASGPVELPIPARVLPSYLALGEIVCVGAPITGEGYFATLNRPSVHDFVAVAMQTFDKLGDGQELVSVGAWLEGLIRDHGVHPVIASERLHEASAAGIIERVTEGSTTDTRHDDHTLRVLRKVNGHPAVQTTYLYRGDFLIPGKSSTSLRLAVAKP